MEIKHALLSADFFKIFSFLKIYFMNTTRTSYSLDPDKAQQFVVPDLRHNCLQRLSADNTFLLSVDFFQNP